MIRAERIAYGRPDCKDIQDIADKAIHVVLEEYGPFTEKDVRGKITVDAVKTKGFPPLLEYSIEGAGKTYFAEATVYFPRRRGSAVVVRIRADVEDVKTKDSLIADEVVYAVARNIIENFPAKGARSAKRCTIGAYIRSRKKQKKISWIEIFSIARCIGISDEYIVRDVITDELTAHGRLRAVDGEELVYEII